MNYKKISILIGATILSLMTGCSIQKVENTTNQQNEKQQEVQQGEQESQFITSISRHPHIADYSFINGIIDKLPGESDFGYDIRSTDLSKIDLINEYDTLINYCFDSKTNWPENLPEGFDPEELMELYKNPGLNIRSLHEQGITGKGVGIAIIDQPLLVDHIEYKDQLKYYSERDSVSSQQAAMHGAAVASIAVGKNVGVAPEADLYYIADDFFRVKEDHSYLAESINQILDLNKTLPYENRIRVISISWGYDADSDTGNDKLFEAYDRAKEEGILVITTSLFLREDFEFFGLDKIPLSDADDINSYTKQIYGMPGQTYNISVPMNFRCTASPTGYEDYTVYPQGGKSWATPYVAGLYALACQVKPDITYEEFWELAASTGRSSSGKYNGNSYWTRYIVDPVKIIEKLKKAD